MCRLKRNESNNNANVTMYVVPTPQKKMYVVPNRTK